MIDVPTLVPNLGPDLKMRNMLIVGISRPTDIFFYHAHAFTPVYIFTCYKPDELNFVHTSMGFDLDEVLKTLPVAGIYSY